MAPRGGRVAATASSGSEDEEEAGFSFFTNPTSVPRITGEPKLRAPRTLPIQIQVPLLPLPSTATEEHLSSSTRRRPRHGCRGFTCRSCSRNSWRGRSSGTVPVDGTCPTMAAIDPAASRVTFGVAQPERGVRSWISSRGNLQSLALFQLSGGIDEEEDPRLTARRVERSNEDESLGWI
ncbi:hypothetical protein EJB05_01813, partial [Eragrostis curvula]